MRTLIMNLYKQIKSILKNENVVPVAQAFSSDMMTALMAFMQLKKQHSECFFLESVEGGENIGRYSFMGVEPFETLSVSNSQVKIKSTKKTESFASDRPFKYIDNYLKKYRALKREGLPPFCGGAVGMVSYEAINYLEKLPATKDKNFGEFPDIYLMLYKTIVAFDRVTDHIIIISNIFLDEVGLRDGLMQAFEQINQIAETIFSDKTPIERLRIDKSAPHLASELIASWGEEGYIDAVRQVKKHVKAGDIFQCVLSDQFMLPIQEDPLTIYRCLRATVPAPYLYFLESEQFTLLGASPEMLCKVHEGVAYTHPIAGTRPRGQNRAEDLKLEKELMSSVKENAEHLMLVDLGRNDLGRVCRPGSVQVDRFREVHRYSNVMHLVSQVSGVLKNNQTAWDAFCSCFPAGTLTGAPKIRAMEIINDLEPTGRGPYGGAIVYADFGGSFDSCITIRSLLIKNGRGYFQAGAGIVYDSRPVAEYNEVKQKSNAIGRALSMAQKFGRNI